MSNLSILPKDKSQTG